MRRMQLLKITVPPMLVSSKSLQSHAETSATRSLWSQHSPKPPRQPRLPAPQTR